MYNAKARGDQRMSHTKSIVIGILNSVERLAKEHGTNFHVFVSGSNTPHLSLTANINHGVNVMGTEIASYWINCPNTLANHDYLRHLAGIANAHIAELATEPPTSKPAEKHSYTVHCHICDKPIHLDHRPPALDHIVCSECSSKMTFDEIADSY